MEIHKNLYEILNVSISIGVTTGTAFVGSVGSGSRCEYSIVGDTVNLSARLMVASSNKGGGIICDGTTFNAGSTARGRTTITFETLEPIKVKGKEKMISIYTP